MMTKLPSIRSNLHVGKSDSATGAALFQRSTYDEQSTITAQSIISGAWNAATTAP